MTFANNKNRLNGLPEKKQRFDFIDQMRGLVVVFMLVDHASYYLDSIWRNLDPLDPLFSTWGQFFVRYIPYLCAPGFLIISGSMVLYAYRQRVAKGIPVWTIRWHLIQRGLFLIVLQLIWVNSAWGGFQSFQPGHFGIVASIGVSIIFLTMIVQFRWYIQLFIAIGILLIHPFLITIPYNPDITWQMVIMQTFIDAGTFNKYPVLPWFAQAILGAVMAQGWLYAWKTDKKRIYMGIGIGLLAIILSILVRMNRGYGNIFPFSDFGSFSFLFDQKYPPSLYHSLWFFGWVVLSVTAFIAMGKAGNKIFMIFTIPGRVALFFYAMHIAILGIFVKRIDFYYREGGILETSIGFVVVLAIMLPLCQWFYGVKRRSKNYFIRMI